jgi:hypothetical protein
MKRTKNTNFIYLSKYFSIMNEKMKYHSFELFIKFIYVTFIYTIISSIILFYFLSILNKIHLTCFSIAIFNEHLLPYV